ncbi:MAG: excinuclease ABC subunit UvrC [Candidatus Thorarchaeota archaeon]
MFTMSVIRDLVNTLPEAPGVYLWKDASGEVIYVGKAKSLRKRVQSYISRRLPDRKTWELMQRAADLETIITNTEREALLLEMALIKKYQPKYNLALKSDHRHAWIRIDRSRSIPVVEVTRDATKDGAIYFGPYGSTRRVERLLDSVRRFIPVASCSRPESVRRECIQYHIGRCSGPCKGHIGPDEYNRLVDQLCLYLGGQEGQLIEMLTHQMEAAARALEFELAATLRDRLTDLKRMSSRQRVILTEGGNIDSIGIARSEHVALVELLVIRGGQLVSSEHFLFDAELDVADEEILTAFVEQYYFLLPVHPDEILLPLPIASLNDLDQWLNQDSDHHIRVYVPTEGRGKDLIAMAGANASRSLKKILILGESRDDVVDGGVKDLMKVLGLSRLPTHMECFDVANIQGTDSAGSCVVFKNGQPSRTDYRMFRVKTKATPDDYAMMKEVVYRRYRGVVERNEPLPDLIVVDGGKGQLSAAQQALSELGIDYVPVAALAKREETVFMQGISDGLKLPDGSPALHLMQRIRDEAHRFAQRYHHRLREKRLSRSALEDVTGIGPVRSKKLLEKFGSLDRMREATIHELAGVEGMTEELARALKAWLDQHSSSTLSDDRDMTGP